MFCSPRVRALVLVLLTLGVSIVSRGEAQRYPVRQYTVGDGLPSGHVRDVVQDARGRIWLATRAGVVRYDGRGFETYNLDDGLAWADQLALRWDADGVLWSLGARVPIRLYHFDDARWHPLPWVDDDVADAKITAFAVLGGERERVFAVGTEDGLLYGDGLSWRQLIPDGARVMALALRDGRLLVATPDRLMMLMGDQLATLPVTLPAKLSGMAVESIAPEGTDRVWLAGEGWVGELRGGRLRVHADDVTLATRPDVPLVLAPDYRGGLYLGGSDGLHHFHPDAGWSTLGRDSGLVADGATALLLDRENNLWVGSERGVSKIAGRRFATFTRLHGLYDDEVTAALSRADGRVVLGHRGGLSVISDLGTIAGPRVESRPLRPPGPADQGPPERVWDLAEDGAGGLWIAHGSAGLARLASNGEPRWLGPAEGLEGDVTSVLRTAAGELWAATDRGLYRRREQGFERHPEAPPELHVRRVLPAAGGGLLLATARGLHRVDGDRWQTWCRDAGDDCGSVFAALEHDGAVWVGTSEGLLHTVSGGLAVVAHPRIDQPIFFIVRDDQERIWFGTDNGVLRWDGEELRHFTVQDGLAGRETQRAAGMVDSRGRVWIGTENGITVYTEPSRGRPAAPPLVELRGIEVADRELELDAPRRLEHAENDLTFRFHVISLTDETRITVESRLEGLENSWRRHPGGEPWELRYDNLSPGSYRLHLRAISATGERSEEIRSAPVVIAKPYWQRPWFALALLLLLGGSAFGGRRLLSQRRRARWLEAEVARRVAEVTAEQERMVVTLRNIADGVVTTDAQGDIIFLNSTALEITGWGLDEAVGQPLGQVLVLRRVGDAGEPYDPFRLLVARNLEALERTETVELETRGGKRRLVEISGSPIVHSRGRHAGLVVAFRDVSEKRRLEQDLLKAQKLEALGILAGGIAHDFNNLLTVLLGNLSLLEGLGQSDAHVRHLRAAEAAVLRARDLTRQLLTFSRGGTPVRAAASIAEVIRESTSFVLRGANVRCEIDLPEDLWVVEIDAGQINQVLNNLLINAMQAMPEGGTVRITGRNVLGPAARLAAARYVAIEIADEGVGIAEKDLGRIFDPYFSTKGTGRGLGLASAYSIVRQHEGRLSVSSKLGQGTVFRLHLPATDARLAQSSSVDLPVAEASGRVLIMDDDAAVRETTGAMIERFGYRVDFAKDGEGAIAAYRAALADGEPFTVVIMDLTIPGGMGGKEAIGRLRAIDPEVRAIVASGYSNDPVLAQHREHGFLGRIEKPFQSAHLARVLDEVVNATPRPPASSGETGSRNAGERRHERRAPDSGETAPGPG